jgi:homoserine kinase type II
VQAALRAYPLPPARTFVALACGTVNTNARLELPDGRALFLRVNEGKSEADVAYEARLCAHLAERGVATPPPVRARDGAGYARIADKLVTLFPWSPGEHAEAAGVTPAHAAAVGRALAELHIAGAGFTERRTGIYTLDNIGERVAAFEHTSDPLLAPLLPKLKGELARVAAERAGTLPEGIIHQDLFRDNVLFAVGTADIAALLDFEQAVWGRFAYDLAVCLLAWCYHEGAFNRPACIAMVAGYDTVRPLATDERAALHGEACVAAVRFTVTRITDVYLRASAGAPAGKDFRSYWARLATLRQSGLPISS